MAVRTVTVELELRAASYLADGREVVRVNDEMGRAFTRLSTRATAASGALDDTSRNIRQLGRRADRAESQVRELREEIDRLTASALAAAGPVNIINQGGGGGGGMGGGFFGMIRRGWEMLPTELKITIGIIAGIIATAFVTALGASIAAAMTLVLAVAVTAGLVAIAAKTSDAVQHAFMGALAPVGGQLKEWAAVAIDPLILAAHDFGDAWFHIGPQVKEMFDLMAHSIRPLAAGLIGFVEDALPGLRSALGNAGPVVAQFARDLPMVGREFGNMFSRMSQGQGVIKGMHFLMLTLATIFKITGDTIHGLAVAFDWLTEHSEKVNAFLGKIPLLGAPFKWMAEVIGKINEAGKGGGIQEFGDAAADASLDIDKAAGATTALEKAINGLNQRMDESVRRMTGMMDAQIAYEAAIDEFTKSVKENGRNLDIHTEKGRANVTAGEQILKNAYAIRQAFIDQNSATMGLDKATSSANATFRASVDSLAAQMKQLGFTQGQIHALLDQWYALINAPNPQKSVTVTTYYRTSGQPASTRASPNSVRSAVASLYRQGGIAYARRGLMNLSGQAGIARAGSPLVGFAESGTGGEAFIARNAPAGRSLGIANTAASWHGGAVVPQSWLRGRSGGAPTVVIQPILGGTGSADAAFAKMWDDMVYSGRLRAKVVNNRLAPV